MTTARDDVSLVAAIRQALEAAENAGDADAFAALLTDDAVLMVPDFPTQESKTASVRFVREMMGWLLTRYTRRITYVSAEIAVIGDMALDRGTFWFDVTPKEGGDSTRVTGKYLWLLRRTDPERWKITRLIVSRNEESDRADRHDSSVTPNEDLADDH